MSSKLGILETTDSNPSEKPMDFKTCQSEIRKLFEEAVPDMNSKQKDDLDFFFCRLMEHKSSFLDTISKRLLDYEKDEKKKCEQEILNINYNADLFVSRLDTSASTLNAVKAVEQFVNVRCTYKLDEYLERHKNKVIKLNEGRIKIKQESSRQNLDMEMEKLEKQFQLKMAMIENEKKEALAALNV
ncbi:hypothetical protein L5515_018266 [Caenorhabditis briggsae]|uniref:Uncharacterized protein n=1 Tax=Caenorhabditis briggsae TaxID=6238 RepID=A0AAE9FFC8_CAEBR|nr:hypothetical protein L5515_018266 [Caenorhabditis briggsae]